MRIRNLVAMTAALLVLTSAASAQAEGLNNLAAGANGLLTAPVDPMLFALEPPEVLEDMWGAPVTTHTFGFLTGVVMLPYRAVMGALDIVLFPFWVFPTLSPEPKFDLYQNMEFEVEYP
jgi:hypothetical protein